MKKVRKAAAVTAVMAAFLSACGNLSGGSVDSGEIVAPEMSSEDLLVSSLELLLQEEEVPKEVQDLSEAEAEAEMPESEAKAEVEMPESAAKAEAEMSGSAAKAEAETPESAVKAEAEMSGSAKEQEEDGAAQEEQKERGAAQDEQERVPSEQEAVIFYGNAGSYDLSREIVPFEEKTAEELVDALARHNIVSLDTKVLSFEVEETAEEKILYLDLSRAAGEYLKTMSREAECIILASVVNTFLENYEADGVCITVDGRQLTTKNAEYTTALKRCTPEELLERSRSEEAVEETPEQISEETDGKEEEHGKGQ